MIEAAVPGYRSATEINTAMSRVYGNMAAAVLVSMIVSFIIGTTPVLQEFFLTGIMKYVSIFLPLPLVFLIGFLLQKDSVSKSQAQTMLLVFSAAMGLSFASIWIVYQLGSIFTAFMSAAVLFSVMSLWGYFTRRSLDSWGQYLFVAVIALIIVSLINVFIGSSVMQMIISAVAVLVFLALTAYDTQQIRETVSVNNDGKLEVIGALSLYINFINIFLSLLQLFGNKNE